MIGKHQNKYLNSIGTRILCELNDLKRTMQTAAHELGYEFNELQNIINGYSTEQKTLELINKMGKVYPIDHLQLCLLEDDTINGIRFVDSKQSKQSSRIYKRPNKNGQLTNYYDYRDTAMSKLSLFKPEWIQVLREVNNCEPYNPDVVMNNGHFMHQVTMFIGPVNFYYEDSDGHRHCCEMNTGDSNYITPFMKHSFASRDKDSFTCILAVTFGADVSRSQRELYALGPEAIDNLNIGREKASRKLIKQHMNNNFFTSDILNKIIGHSDFNINSLLNSDNKITEKQYQLIASALGVNVSDLKPPNNKKQDECVIKYIKNLTPHFFYVKNKKRYEIYTLAKSLKIPTLTSTIIKVTNNEHDLSHSFKKTLHTYIINFSEYPTEIKWKTPNGTFTKTINKYDSVYIKPFVSFSLKNTTNKNSSLFVVGIPTSINTQTQKELSSLMKPERVINDLETWYDY